ncbi:hypothetical protein M3J09_013213 [Ascochyta lentis]
MLYDASSALIPVPTPSQMTTWGPFLRCTSPDCADWFKRSSALMCIRATSPRPARRCTSRGELLSSGGKLSATNAGTAGETT